MITLLHGEAFLVDRALDRLTEAGRARLTTDFSFERLDPGASLEALQQAIQTPPFLDAFRLVTWKNPALVADGRRAQGDALDRLAAALESMEDAVHLVLALHRTLPSMHRILRACQQLQENGRATVQRFDIPRRSELPRWVESEARHLGVVLSRDAVWELISRSEPDLGILYRELEKLALHAQGRPVDKGAVAGLVASNRSHSIFALTDALAQPGSDQPLRLLGSLYEEGAAPAYIQFMLTQHFLRLLQARLLQDEGRPPEAVRSLLGGSYAAEKAQEQAARWSVDALQQALRELYDLEWEIKSGQIEAEPALEALVFGLSAPR